MGVIIPQVVTSDKASGAQIFDGSLRFNKGNKTTFNKNSWIIRKSKNMDT